MRAKGQDDEVLIDGAGHRLGRLASRVAKMLLEGKRVTVLNAEKILLTGTKEAVMERYLMLSQRKWLSSLSVVKVWYPKRADRIFWYTVARMLPRKRPRGREALSRLRVHIGVPAKYTGLEGIKVDDALHRGEVSRSGRIVRVVSLGEVSSLLRGGEKRTG